MKKDTTSTSGAKGRTTKKATKVTSLPQLFELGLSGHDGMQSILFFHEGKTKKQFMEDLKFLVRKYGDHFIRRSDYFIYTSDWVLYFAKKFPELGYRRITPVTLCFTPTTLGTNKEMKYDSEWAKVLGAELYQRALSHNNKFWEEQEKKWIEEGRPLL